MIFQDPMTSLNPVLTIGEQIAESRIEIEQARLLTLKAAHLMDTVGNKAARIEIAAIKVAAPAMALKIVDRAIQVHGGAGVSRDVPLTAFFNQARSLRLADGPEHHLRNAALGQPRRRRGQQRLRAL